jgi:hypothetical protein
MNELSKALVSTEKEVAEGLVRELDAAEVKAVAGGPAIWV